MATDIEKGRIKERIGFKAKSRLSFSGFLALFADQIRALFCLRNDNHNCRVCDGKRHALVISASVRALNTALGAHPVPTALTSWQRVLAPTGARVSFRHETRFVLDSHFPNLDRGDRPPLSRTQLLMCCPWRGLLCSQQDLKENDDGSDDQDR